MSGRNKGFTLVEVMVAVTIVTMLLFTVYGVFTSVSRAKIRLEKDGESYHQARVLFDRIGREIRGAYYSRRNPDTLFAGGENSDGNPYLALSTTAFTPQGGRGAGISLVRYELVDDPETEDEGKVLMRGESPLFDTESSEEGYRLATGIESMKLRFYGDGDWHDDWQASEDGLPKMVEVTLELLVDESAVPFRSAFEVPAIEVRQ